MAWITVSLDDLKGRITGPELTALQTAALATAQPDPVPEEMERVIREVRGYVAACKDNNIGAGNTIPDELLDAALALMVHRIATRLPSKVMLTDQRVAAKDDALRLLQMVATCKFAIVQPETETDEQYVITLPSFTGRTAVFKREQQDGV